MTKEIITVNPSEFGIEEKKAHELMGNLPQIKAERQILESKYAEVIKLDLEDPKTAKIAKDLRLMIRDNRTKGIEVWHRTTKDFFLKGGQFVDSIKRLEIAENIRMEENLEQMEKHFENLEKQRIEQLNNDRIDAIRPYVDDVTGLQLGTMEEDVFAAYLSAKETAYEAKIEAQRKAEEERIAAEKAEAEAREQQRIENERLKAEADKREKEIQAERAANEKRLADERAKAEADRKKIEAENAEKLRIANAEKVKAEAELQKKRDEAKAEQDRKDAEEKRLKAEAIKKAKAPIQKQLSLWVDEFTIPVLNLENEKKVLIEQKFNAFKEWAKKEIENL